MGKSERGMGIGRKRNPNRNVQPREEEVRLKLVKG